MVEVDFDETCFTTFISRGNGVEVHQAYEMALELVLGQEARQDFSDYNGLSNRAPLDVIVGLISENPRLINNALDHAKEFFAHPDDITDIGLGLVARFANRGTLDHDELTLRAITEMLVIRKKEVLVPQITAEWPMAVKGFDEAWLDIAERQKTDERWARVHTAIVSSGHTDFIQLVLDGAGMPRPDVYMTDDEMRRQVHPLTKPDPYALQLVRNAWQNAYLIGPELRKSAAFEAETKSRSVYIGDDHDKDGRMAANDGIKFLHHDGSADAWHNIGKQLVRAVEIDGVFSV